MILLSFFSVFHESLKIYVEDIISSLGVAENPAEKSETLYHSPSSHSTLSRLYFYPQYSDRKCLSLIRWIRGLVTLIVSMENYLYYCVTFYCRRFQGIKTFTVKLEGDMKARFIYCRRKSSSECTELDNFLFNLMKKNRLCEKFITFCDILISKYTCIFSRSRIFV